MGNPFDTINRSFKQLNLTPGERAFVKLLEGWLFTAIGAGAAIGYQMLMSGSVDYTKIAQAAGGAALLTLLLSVKKYLSSQTDLPLPEATIAAEATNVAIAKVEQALPSATVSQVINPPVVSSLQPPYNITDQPTMNTLPNLTAIKQQFAQPTPVNPS